MTPLDSRDACGKGSPTEHSGPRLAVIGAGPAGLTAALEAARQRRSPLVIEALSQVGGLARTCNYKGYRFDLGGHRFYTKVEDVDRLWREMLGKDFLRRPRLSRILYRGRYFQYPPQIGDVLRGLGFVESLRVVASWAKAQVRPDRPERSFAHWVSNRFGKHLFSVFFRSYTEKVWGISCDDLRADWAAQRIRGLSLLSAVRNAFQRDERVKSLIAEFDYPRLGPGMMWEAMRDRIVALGGEVRTGAEVTAIFRQDRRVRAVEISSDGERCVVPVAHLLATMPLPELIRRMQPPPSGEILRAADALKHRAFITVCLLVRRGEVFPDNWIYVQEPNVRVARIQNFKNWSPAMVPDAMMTSLGLEYFCDEGDELWRRPDEELIELATHELVAIGLAAYDEVTEGRVERVPHAYPVYDIDYADNLACLREFVDGFENLVTAGRNGLHRYNNQDHSMVTAMLGVRKLLDDEGHDLWSVNTDDVYLEDMKPAPADQPSPAILRQAEGMSFPTPRTLPSAASTSTVLRRVR
jgi:protoporphyrinogen oxidase